MAPDPITCSVQPRINWILPTVAALIAVLLLAVIPRSSLAGGFSHDSAYIARVAQNVVDGKGLVNDALWPVFLKPAELPMPFHNQNPLYGILIATLSLASGITTTVSGFAISALAAAALMWGVAVLVKKRLNLGAPTAIAIGLLSVLYPPVWNSAWTLVPDALCAALLLWSVVWVTRDGLWATALAGLFFGLAWLTRSTATLAVPSIFLYLMMAHGLRRGITRGFALVAVAIVVALPWLVHTAAVWGSPLRSDASFVVMGNYHAVLEYGGDPERYWHAAAFPATFGEVLRNEPLQWVAYYLRSVPVVLKYFVKGLSGAMSSRTAPIAVLALLVVVTVACADTIRHRRNATPERNAFAAAFALYFVTQLLVFGMLGRSFEIRYIALFSAGVGALLATCWLGALRQVTSRTALLRGRSIVVLAAGVVLLLFALREDAVLLARARATVPEKAAYFATARAVAALDPGGAPVVVGQHPYYFSVATGRRALSIPLGEADLEEFMDRYHARFVILTDDEMDYWRPSWRRGALLPSFLRLYVRLDGASVFVASQRPD